VGPTCHIRRQPLDSNSNPNQTKPPPPAPYAAALLASGDSPANAHASRHLSALRRPPRSPPAAVSRHCLASRARAVNPPPRVWAAAGFSSRPPPSRLAGDHKRGAQGQFHFHSRFSLSPSCCGEHKQFPLHCTVLGLLCTVPLQLGFFLCSAAHHLCSINQFIYHASLQIGPCYYYCSNAH
jgi:hypothetical protein